MKKPLFLVFIIATTLNFAFAQTVTGDSWSTVKSSGAGTLGIVYYEQPGLISKMPDGKLKGVCVDIVSDFAAFVETTYGKKIERSICI